MKMFTEMVTRVFGDLSTINHLDGDTNAVWHSRREANAKVSEE